MALENKEARFLAAVYQESKAERDRSNREEARVIPEEPSLAHILFPGCPGTLTVFRPDGVPIDIEHIRAFNAFWQMIAGSFAVTRDPEGMVPMARERFESYWDGFKSLARLPHHALASVPSPWKAAGLQSGGALAEAPVKLYHCLYELGGVGAWCRQMSICQDPHTGGWNVRNRSGRMVSRPW
jgi:hypothetical protein